MFPLSSRELPSRSTSLLPDLDMQDVCRFCDLPEAPLIRSRVANYVAGEVDNDYKHNLTIESVWPNARRAGSSTAPVPADGAGGSGID